MLQCSMSGEDFAEKRVLVLQGGGALGAYQAGAYEALSQAGIEPDWIAGISIGAINAAIIAGNKPGTRVARLRTFWETVSSGLQGTSLAAEGHGRTLFNDASSWLATVFGIPGFFSPRPVAPVLAWPGTEAALSYYDTTPLRATLAELVDFKQLNHGGIRTSLGAVQVRTGNFRYFDTRRETLRVEHIMASGALPPGFPPVMIGDQPYWDGGLVSNTPLQYVVDEENAGQDLCIFQVDLFSARGAMPRTIMEVAEREKEIRFSSRTRMNTTMEKDLHDLRRAARRLAQKLPAEFSDDPDLKQLTARAGPGTVTVMHLINRPTDHDTHAKDYEFSRLSVEEHWQAGRRDVETSLNHPDWRNRTKDHAGLVAHDLTREKQE